MPPWRAMLASRTRAAPPSRGRPARRPSRSGTSGRAPPPSAAPCAPACGCASGTSPGSRRSSRTGARRGCASGTACERRGRYPAAASAPFSASVQNRKWTDEARSSSATSRTPRSSAAVTAAGVGVGRPAPSGRRWPGRRRERDRRDQLRVVAHAAAVRGVRPAPVEDELAVAVGLEVKRAPRPPARPPSRASTRRGTQPARAPTLPDASSAARKACSRNGSSSPASRSHVGGVDVGDAFDDLDVRWPKTSRSRPKR